MSQPRDRRARAPQPHPTGRQPRRNLLWLASYPKSGNTWLRIFLANYMLDRQTPLPINEVHRLGVTDAAAELFRRAAGAGFVPADPLSTLRLRSRVLAWLAGNDADVLFVKTHAIKSRLFGVEMIPAALSRSAIYILRNPLDMVLSYARHFGVPLEDAAVAIGRSDTAIAASGKSVKQYIGSWSGHVRSWSQSRDLSVLTLRYEDMLTDPHGAFAKALAHVGIPFDKARLDRAVQFSSFDELSRQEATDRFLEHGEMKERFFHSGQAGAWRDALPEALADRIRSDHGAVMRRFGYLDG